jgi:hypothetical protein
MHRLSIRPGASLTVLTGRGALAVQLVLRLRGRAAMTVRPRRTGGGARWRLDLPATALRGSATLRVRFPLGVAMYRVALGPSS